MGWGGRRPPLLSKKHELLVRNVGVTVPVPGAHCAESISEIATEAWTVVAYDPRALAVLQPAGSSRV